MSDIQKIRLCGNHVAIAFRDFHIFGSGSYSAWACINGQRLTHEMCAERGWITDREENGFVGHDVACIPFRDFLKLESVSLNGKTARSPSEIIAAYRRSRENTSPNARRQALRTWRMRPKYWGHDDGFRPLARLAAQKLGWQEAHGSGMYHEHWAAPATTKAVEYDHRRRAWGVRAVATTRVVTIPLKRILGMKMPASIKLP